MSELDCMRSGELTEQVTVLKPVHTRNSYNEVITTYKEGMTIPMKVVSDSGSKYDDSNEIIQTHSVTFYCYYFGKQFINEDCLLRWENKRYKINGISAMARRNEMTMTCEKINE